MAKHKKQRQKIRKEQPPKSFPVIGWICLAIILFFAAVLIIPVTRKIFISLSNQHPYIMAFIKFGILATIGEILALRISKKVWQLPVKLTARIIIWGFLGVTITLMMGFFKAGVTNLTGFSGSSTLFWQKLLFAFLTSTAMNIIFAPTFMSFHKCSDKFLELSAANKHESPKISTVVNSIEWDKFVSFTLFKTIPLFWIPAHTITFLLPEAYQVIMAASLSVALGIILSIKNNKK